MKKFLIFFCCFICIVVFGDLELAKKYYAARNYKQSYRLFHSLAVRGNAEAQMYVAIFLFKNLIKDSTSPNPIVWLEKSAQGKCPNAMGLLAIFYLNDKKYEEGINLLEEAASLGSGYAQYHLGRAYECSLWGKKQDREQAIFWLNKATEDEITKVDASLCLGIIYYYKKNDLWNAIKYFKIATNENDPIAPFFLFQIYFWGEDYVLKDFKQAKAYFSLALKNGNMDAFVLAGALVQGLGNVQIANLYFEHVKIQKKSISSIIKEYEDIIQNENFSALIDYTKIKHKKEKTYKKEFFSGLFFPSLFMRRFLTNQR